MGFFKKAEIKKNYDIGEALGSGNFTVVKKATRKTDGEGNIAKGKVVAIKIIDKAKVEDMGDVEREIEIMGKVDHPNIIKLVEVFDVCPPRFECASARCNFDRSCVRTARANRRARRKSTW